MSMGDDEGRAFTTPLPVTSTFFLDLMEVVTMSLVSQEGGFLLRVNLSMIWNYSVLDIQTGNEQTVLFILSTGLQQHSLSS